MWGSIIDVKVDLSSFPTTFKIEYLKASGSDSSLLLHIYLLHKPFSLTMEKSLFDLLLKNIPSLQKECY